MTDGNSKPLLAYNIWLALPAETRVKLTALFSIPRTGEVIVRSMGLVNGNIGGEVQQDGHAAKDLWAITVEKMQDFTGSKHEDFYKLFDETLKKLNAPLATDNPKHIDNFEKNENVFIPKKRGRPAKKA